MLHLKNKVSINIYIVKWELNEHMTFVPEQSSSGKGFVFISYTFNELLTLLWLFVITRAKKTKWFSGSKSSLYMYV